MNNTKAIKYSTLLLANLKFDFDKFIELKIISNNKQLFNHVNEATELELKSIEFISELLNYHLPQKDVLETAYFKKLDKIILEEYLKKFLINLSESTENKLNLGFINPNDIFDTIYFNIIDNIESTFKEFENENGVKYNLDFYNISLDIKSMLSLIIKKDLKKVETKFNMSVLSSVYKNSNIAESICLLSQINLAGMNVNSEFILILANNYSVKEFLEIPTNSLDIISEYIATLENETDITTEKDIDYFMDSVDLSELQNLNKVYDYYDVNFVPNSIHKYKGYLTEVSKNLLKDLWVDYVSELQKNLDELNEEPTVFDNMKNEKIKNLLVHFNFNAYDVLDNVPEDSTEKSLNTDLRYILYNLGLDCKFTDKDKNFIQKVMKEIILKKGSNHALKNIDTILNSVSKDVFSYIETQNSTKTPIKEITDDLNVKFSNYVLKYITKRVNNELAKYTSLVTSVPLNNSKYLLKADSMNRMERLKECLSYIEVDTLLKDLGITYKFTKPKAINESYAYYVELYVNKKTIVINPEVILIKDNAEYHVLCEVGNSGMITSWETFMKKNLVQELSKNYIKNKNNLLLKLANLFELSVNRRKKVNKLAVNTLIK